MVRAEMRGVMVMASSAVCCILFLPLNFAYLFDFGLMENERLLVELAREEQQLLAGLARVQQQQPHPALAKLLSRAASWDNTSVTEFVQYPVNVFHLIKRNLQNHVRLKAFFQNEILSPQVVEKVSDLYEQTELFKSLEDEDLQQSVNALAIMIHSHGLDIEEFSRGIVRADTATLQVPPAIYPDIYCYILIYPVIS